MKKILLVMTLVIGALTACGSGEEPREEKFGYDLLDDYHVVYDVEFSEIMGQIENGDPIILYVGRSSCPHCYEYLPLLSESAKEEEMIVTYLNYERYAGSDGKFPDELIEFFATYNLEYVPIVFLFKDGEVVDTFSTSVGSKEEIKNRLSELK